MLNAEERRAMIRGMLRSLDLAAYKRLLTLINQERGAKATALAGLKPVDVLPRQGDRHPSATILATLVERWNRGGPVALEEALDAITRAAGEALDPTLLTLRARLFGPEEAPPEEDVWDDATQALPRGVSVEEMLEAAAHAQEWSNEHTSVVDANLWAKLKGGISDLSPANKPRGYALGEGEGEYEDTNEGSLGHLLGDDLDLDEGGEATAYTPSLDMPMGAQRPHAEETQFLLELELEPDEGPEEGPEEGSEATPARVKDARREERTRVPHPTAGAPKAAPRAPEAAPRPPRPAPPPAAPPPTAPTPPRPRAPAPRSPTRAPEPRTRILEVAERPVEEDPATRLLPTQAPPPDTLYTTAPVRGGDRDAPPVLREVVYLSHRQRQSSGGLVELSFSGLPEGLHALRLTGQGLGAGGTLSFEGIPGARGVDLTLGREAFFYFNMAELSPLLHRRVRYRNPRGQETQLLPIFVSEHESSHSVIPETPPGSAWVPPGVYQLPEPSGARPRTLRCDEGLFLGIHPVSHGEFERFLTATHFKPKDDTDYLRQARDGRLPGALSEHPVVYVSHEDARAYAQWVGGRLPTEDEWLRAAVGLDGRPFPWGPGADPRRMNTRESRVGWSTPRGTYPEGAGPFGHQDLLGNVWEWTRTPAEGSDPPHRVIKGASWVNGASMATPGARSFALPQARQFYLGFRVAWDAPGHQGERTHTVA